MLWYAALVAGSVMSVIVLVVLVLLVLGMMPPPPSYSADALSDAEKELAGKKRELEALELEADIAADLQCIDMTNLPDQVEQLRKAVRQAEKKVEEADLF
jgi:hypothetical protein